MKRPSIKGSEDIMEPSIDDPEPSIGKQNILARCELYLQLDDIYRTGGIYRRKRNSYYKYMGFKLLVAKQQIPYLPAYLALTIAVKDLECHV